MPMTETDRVSRAVNSVINGLSRSAAAKRYRVAESSIRRAMIRRDLPELKRGPKPKEMTR